MACLCPNCEVPLERVVRAEGEHFLCPECGGRLADVSLMKRAAGALAIDHILADPSAPAQDATTCPICGQRMATSSIKIDLGPEGRLEFCRKCNLFWVTGLPEHAIAPAPAAASPDLSEGETIPLADSPATEVPIPEYKSSLIGDALNDAELPPLPLWRAALGLLAMPIESSEDEPIFAVSFSLAYVPATIVITAVAWMLTGEVPELAGWAAFLPSFFVQGGVFQLIATCYFIATVGDRVERALNFSGLVTLAVLTALCGFGLFYVTGTAAGIGPGAGSGALVAAMLVFYALHFSNPGTSAWSRARRRRLRLPSWSTLLYWLAAVIVGVFLQFGGFGVPFLIANLGGAVAGTLLWGFMRRTGQFESD